MNLFRTKPIAADVAADTGMRRDLNAFDLTMLALIVIGSLPLQLWRSPLEMKPSKPTKSAPGDAEPQPA